MTAWFNGSRDLACTLDEVEAALEDPVRHHVEVVRRMPGLTRVELVEQQDDHITIETNEGVMTRTGVRTTRDGDRLVSEYDEEYRTPKLTVSSHHAHEFVSTDGGVVQHTTLRDVEAPGLLGATYRRLGRANIGNAIMDAYDAFLAGGDSE